MNRNWICVYLAGITEILWAIGLKYSDSWWEWVITFALIIMAFVLTIKASEVLPVATVYVVFTGIGAVGTNLVDIFVFREPVSAMKVVFIVLLIAGIIGLKLVTDKPEDSGESDRDLVSENPTGGFAGPDGYGADHAENSAIMPAAAGQANDSEKAGEVR